MKHENKRIKKASRSLGSVLQRVQRRLDKARRYRQQQKAGTQGTEFVTLLSESFIGSINQSIKTIQEGKYLPVVSKNLRYARINDADTVSNFMDLIKLEELHEVDFTVSGFFSELKYYVKNLYSIDTVVEEDEEFGMCLSIPELTNQVSFDGWICVDYEDGDHFFKNEVGIFMLMVWKYLVNHQQMGDFGGKGVDTMTDWIETSLDDLDPENEDYAHDRKDCLVKLKEMSSSVRRYERLSSYLDTDIDLLPIAKILFSFPDDEEHCSLHSFAFLLTQLDKFTKEWDQNIQPFINYSTIFDTICWVGNRDQYDEFEEFMNEDFGNNGTVIKFQSVSDSSNHLNQNMLDLWALAKNKKFIPQPIETFVEIIKNIYNAEIITDFAGLPDKGNILTAVYRELDRQSGCGAGEGGKWESIATATSFAGVFKKAYQLS